MDENTEQKAAAPAVTPMAGGPEPQQGTPTPGLSQSPGLRTLANSQVPGLAGGGMVSHVFGPGQSPVDPIAAGLDTGYDPQTRAENRLITQTGAIAAGPRPSTYAEKGGARIPQAGPSDHSTVAAIPDKEAAISPGPNSIGADAPSVLDAPPVPLAERHEPGQAPAAPTIEPGPPAPLADRHAPEKAPDAPATDAPAAVGHA